MDGVYAPDGIRAFYGVFLKRAFWQTGHFTRRSGSETPFSHDLGSLGDRGSLAIILEWTGRNILGIPDFFVKR